MKEWRRGHREATLLDPVVVEAAPDSLDALMAEMGVMLTSYDDRLDMEAVAIKMMAMVCGVNLSNRVLSHASPAMAITNPHLTLVSWHRALHVTTLLAQVSAFSFPRQKIAS